MSRHKTGHISPAPISLGLDLYRRIQNYIKLLPLLPNYVEDYTASIFYAWPLYLSSKPRQMTSNAINRGMQRLWKTYSKKHMNATRLRKAISTAVRKEAPWARDALARHMTHSIATADKFYQINDIRDTAIPVATLIARTVNKKPVSNGYLPFIFPGLAAGKRFQFQSSSLNVFELSTIFTGNIKCIHVQMELKCIFLANFRYYLQYISLAAFERICMHSI